MDVDHDDAPPTMGWPSATQLCREHGVTLDALRGAVDRGELFAVPTPIVEYGGLIVDQTSFDRWRAGIKPIEVEIDPNAPDEITVGEVEKLLGLPHQTIYLLDRELRPTIKRNGSRVRRTYSRARVLAYRAAQRDRLRPGQVARYLGVSLKVLRTLDDVLKPEFSPAGQRVYDRGVVEAYRARRSS